MLPRLRLVNRRSPSPVSNMPFMTAQWRSLGGRSALIAVVAAGVAAVSGLVVMTAASASPGRSARPGGGGPSAPANINPSKTPVLNAPPPQQLGPPVIQSRQEAQAWVAQDPSGRLACFAANGSVVSLLELDRVNPSVPITPAEAALWCSEAAPGSTP